MCDSLFLMLLIHVTVNKIFSLKDLEVAESRNIWKQTPIKASSRIMLKAC